MAEVWIIYRNNDISQLVWDSMLGEAGNTWRFLKCQMKILWQETGEMGTDRLLTILMLLILCLGQLWGSQLFNNIRRCSYRVHGLCLSSLRRHSVSLTLYHEAESTQAHRYRGSKNIAHMQWGNCHEMDIYFNIANYIWSAYLFIHLCVLVYRYMFKLEYKL